MLQVKEIKTQAISMEGFLDRMKNASLHVEELSELCKKTVKKGKYFVSQAKRDSWRKDGTSEERIKELVVSGMVLTANQGKNLPIVDINILRSMFGNLYDLGEI
jgi:hypothetical protein